MAAKFDYTTTIRRLSFNYPLLPTLVTQIVFWCICYAVLGMLIYFNIQGFTASYPMAVESNFTPIIFSAIVIGLFYGSMLGIIDFYLLSKWSKGKSLGRLIFLKTMVYFIALLIIFAFIQFIFWQPVFLPIYFPKAAIFNDKAWSNYFLMLAVFTLLMNLFISVFTQINKKFGPGVLLPFILGKYVQPQIEERAFIFLDLKSSTTHAENLGHKQYSQLIRDCFLDINNVSTSYNAEIYQYVGDEVVLSWLVNKRMNIAACFDFYFECQKVFQQRKKYYHDKFGLLPEFKAGLHCGIVTCVEVGDIKREIAYHGDPLNVAARILAKCNENNADIIFTSSIQEKIDSLSYAYEEIGHVLLKGKNKPVLIYKISEGRTLNLPGNS
ncbi:MAG: adenylate/guanylate cyclase domain-containing protein [Ferruginibacter sp.]